MIPELNRVMRRRRVDGGTQLPGVARPTAYSDEWYTPPLIVAALGPFDLDPCAGPMAHAARNLRREDDGLAQPWSGRVWLNPPYSDLEDWIEKFMRHADGVALVNARPDTRWMQTLLSQASGVLWMAGRVAFSRQDGKRGPATCGSVLVAYGERNAAALLTSGLPGVVMTVRHCIPNAGTEARVVPSPPVTVGASEWR